MEAIKIKQNTLEWHLRRLGRVGGSECHALLGSAKAIQTLAFKKMAEIVDGYQPSFMSEAMIRGHELEPYAIEAYEALHFCTVERDMYYTIDTYFGFSPDGRVNMRTEGRFIYDYYHTIEVKCPQTKEFLRVMLGDKPPKEHVSQCYWQIYHTRECLTSIEEVSLFYFHPAFDPIEFTFHVDDEGYKEYAKKISKGIEVYLGILKTLWDGI